MWPCFYPITQQSESLETENWSKPESLVYLALNVKAKEVVRL